MSIELAKTKDELSKAKSVSEVRTLKHFDAFLRDCVSTSAHSHDRRFTSNEGPAVER